MSILHIFRGLPGSGKSSAARKLAAETGAILIEPDALLIRDGRYDYSPKRFRDASIIALSLVYSASSKLGADIVFADVLPRISDVGFIVSFLYVSKDYEVIVHDLKITAEESKARNIHQVKPEDIDRMAREWEDWEAWSLLSRF